MCISAAGAALDAILKGQRCSMKGISEEERRRAKHLHAPGLDQGCKGEEVQKESD